MSSLFLEWYKFIWFILFFIWAMTLSLVSNFFVCRATLKTFFLFPFFEMFMALNFVMLLQAQICFWPYFILFTAFGITIQTDLSCMLISRFTSIYLVPVCFIFSYFNCLEIGLFESIISSVVGYGFFYLVNKVFFIVKKQNGLGQGDFDLMALIGAYTGILGLWFTIVFGSIIGTISVFLFMFYKKRTISCLPFGPFLSIAAMVFILFQYKIIAFLL